eukprot:Plantae.Rhodophyta-Purpureofilum_apyrenoidigerum.ctg18404.p1 GENE.Plantae.Rhodophyta-Purpureofilum_apyrenoidigerum.ctg18404~~Plantae.Rhodophyta-Purpureofilum_apyrenoidigerum.ctg18404.p1  ORF type:complete len:421 (-),score=63.77 Plantae.Rhodophyta-Purpureofilum_apyrenoidigerum.ctg18404:99-1310(-)
MERRDEDLEYIAAEKVIDERWKQLFAEEEVQRWLFGQEDVAVTLTMVIEGGTLFLHDRRDIGPLKVEASSERKAELQMITRATSITLPIVERDSRMFGLRLITEEMRWEKVVTGMVDGTAVTLIFSRNLGGNNVLQTLSTQGLKIECRFFLVGDNGGMLRPLSSIVVLRDCMFCLMRGEPCTCPRLLWAKAAAVEYGMSAGCSTNAWDRFCQQLSRVMERAMVYDTMMVRSWRIAGKNFLVKSNSVAVGSVLNAVCKNLRVYLSATSHIGTLHDRRKAMHCEICDWAFTSKRQLQAHKARTHVKHRQESGTQKGREFDKGTMQGLAVLSVKPKPRKTYRGGACELCGIEFARTFTLKRHMQSLHRGEKKSKCRQCDEVFTQRTQLLTHMQRKHGNTAIVDEQT